MSWDERQRAMLAEMGLRVWVAPTPAEAEPDPRAAAAAVVVGASAPAVSAPGPSVQAAAVRTPPAASPLAQRPPAPPPALPRAAPVAQPIVMADGDGAARRQAIAEMDWAQLRASVAGCTACGLCESRKNTVFGVGHERAHWMIVGEAPGEQEDLRGEPFVGQAGKLLDSMLRALDLGRGEGAAEQQVYIANTLKCRPPRNRNPEPGEMAQCEPYLDRQIALVQPRLILAMGRFAVQSLLRSSEPIGRLRGRVHQYQGVPLIVTYHPAYLLRNLVDKARAWEDLCLARETAQRTG